jgi:hypothetical protein
MLPVWYPPPGTRQLLRQHSVSDAGRVVWRRDASGRARIEADDAVFVRAEVPHTGLVIGQRRCAYCVRSVDGARRNGSDCKEVAALSRGCDRRRQNVVNQASIGDCRGRANSRRSTQRGQSVGITLGREGCGVSDFGRVDGSNRAN